MPLQCSESVLTGQDGMVMFKPAGTEHCLLDYTDFGPDGDTNIVVPVTHDSKLGDPISFTLKGSAHLDTAFAVGTTYYVVAVGEEFIQVASSLGGAAIEMNGDGGTVGTGIAGVTPNVAVPGAGYANGTYTGVRLVQGVNQTAVATVTVSGGKPTAFTITDPGLGYTTAANTIRVQGGNDGNGNSITAVTPSQVFQGTASLTTRSNTPGAHIEMAYAKYAAVCQVESFQISLTRNKIETTSIPCKVGGGVSKYAPFRTYQSGYADGTGQMTVRFTASQTSLSSRLLANSMLRSQAGAWVKLYVNAVAGSDDEVPDDGVSNYIEAPIALEGISFNATSSGDTPTTATVNFSISGLPKHLFTIDL